MKSYDLIKNESVWSGTKSNITFMHAFLSGADKPAACRKNIKAGSDTLLTQTARARTMLPTNYCETCVNAVIAMADRREASMAPSTGEGDYLPPAEDVYEAEPACICPRMEPPAKFGHHIVCSLRATDTDTEENNDMTIKEGPLTERQIRIIEGLLAGKRHEEISRDLSTPDETVTVNVVKQECQNITAKFKAKTITQAVFVYSEAQAYRKAAQEILKTRIPVPFDQSDEHANHVLDGLAKLYQGRHDSWMPA